jgi:ABC-2 type transport system permease protein
VHATLRLNSEESALRAEPLLATPLSRYRWAASHLVMAFGGSALVLLLANLGAAVTYGLIIRDFYALPKLVAATFAYLPAMWVLVGVTVALYGLLPRFALAAWGVFAATFLIGFLADLLQLPGWVRDVSPFQHVPRVPIAQMTVLPVVVLLAIAVGLTAVGLVGFRRRDTPA